MKYRIARDKSFGYYPDSDTISIGLKSNHNLTDDELIKLISDSLIHEHVHRILDKNFDFVTSCLFDTVQHNFRENIQLKEKYNNNVEIISWLTYIKKCGKRAIWNDYGITDTDYETCKKITSKRKT